MNKRYVPAIASLLIIAVALTSFTPVLATLPTRLVAQPTLRVTTIAEDDEVRETGVMWMVPDRNTFLALQGGAALLGFPSDLLAQFKILVSYNGVPTTPDSTYCQFVEKDKANPLKDKQFTAENLKSVPKESPNFICKFRWGKPGVGVIDVYYIGDFAAQYIADYILVVGVDLTVGRTTVWGTEIQDICLLGWPYPENTPAYIITKPDGTIHYIYPDPLGLPPTTHWTSCEDLALMQKDQVGVPIPWT
jgi:hypothetical protein